MKVLCYGDSNTWGYDPKSSGNDVRFSSGVRWTGLLQSGLPTWKIIEEGVNGRTTDADDPDLPGKNGLRDFPIVLENHLPLNLIILMLGTNDLKSKFSRTPEMIRDGITNLIQVAKSKSSSSLLIISPPIPKLASIYEAYRYPELESKARQLAPLYEATAKKNGTWFLNSADCVVSSDVDGAHFDPDEHKKFSDMILGFLRKTHPDLT